MNEEQSSQLREIYGGRAESLIQVFEELSPYMANREASYAELTNPALYGYAGLMFKTFKTIMKKNDVTSSLRGYLQRLKTHLARGLEAKINPGDIKTVLQTDISKLGGFSRGIPRYSTRGRKVNTGQYIWSEQVMR